MKKNKDKNKDLLKELNERITQPYKTISHEEMLKKFNIKMANDRL